MPDTDTNPSLCERCKKQATNAREHASYRKDDDPEKASLLNAAALFDELAAELERGERLEAENRSRDELIERLRSSERVSKPIWLGPLEDDEPPFVIEWRDGSTTVIAEIESGPVTVMRLDNSKVTQSKRWPATTGRPENA